MRLREVATTMIAAALLVAGAGEVEAKGCIMGAIIGGIAGPYVAERGAVGPLAGRLAANRPSTGG